MNTYVDLPLIERVSAVLRDMLGEDFDAATFWDTLDGETDALDLIGRLIRERVEADAMAEACKEAAATYTTRKQRMEARAKAVNAALGAILDATGEAKVTHPLATVSRTKPRQSLDITDPDAIPSQLCKRVPDTAAVKAQLEAGEAVPGAALVMGEPGVMVRVK
jgi:hypothetical protein